MNDLIQKFGKVAVLMGGVSAEREISLMSGKCVLQALLTVGVNAHKVDVGEDIATVLANSDYDRAFVIVHGRDGEDGKIQALLEYLNISYTGCGIMSSALAMDKFRSKLIALSLNVVTPKQILLTKDFTPDVLADFQFPLAVKPLHEGSSIGVTKVAGLTELEAAINKAEQCNDDVMIEEWIEGDEYTLAIVGGECLPSIKISTPNHQFYDYESKYFDHSTVYDCPSGLSDQQEQEIAAISRIMYDALACQHWGRVDFMRDKHGKFQFIELNTVPGMTETSLVPKAAAQAGMSYQDLVVKILSYTL